MWTLDSQVVKRESVKSGSDKSEYDKDILSEIIVKRTTILARLILAGLHQSDLAWTIYCSHMAARGPSRPLPGGRGGLTGVKTRNVTFSEQLVEVDQRGGVEVRLRERHRGDPDGLCTDGRTDGHGRTG